MARPAGIDGGPPVLATARPRSVRWDDRNLHVRSIAIGAAFALRSDLRPQLVVTHPSSMAARRRDPASGSPPSERGGLAGKLQCVSQGRAALANSASKLSAMRTENDPRHNARRQGPDAVSDVRPSRPAGIRKCQRLDQFASAACLIEGSWSKRSTRLPHWQRTPSPEGEGRERGAVTAVFVA